MSIIDRALDRARTLRGERAWPVGGLVVDEVEERWGHDQSRFSPSSYGNYLATRSQVYAAVTFRARQVSGVQLRFYDNDTPERRLITTGPVPELVRRVNPFFTWERLARLDEQAMGLWGETFWAVEQIPGQPPEIWWLKADNVTPVPHRTDYLAGFLYEGPAGERLAFRPNEIVWQRYPNPLDEYAPLSPLAAARLAADTGQAMMRSNESLHRNGLQIAGTVVPTNDRVRYSREQARELEEDLARRFSGADKAHRWAVLRYEAEFKALGVTPRDAEFVQGLNLTLREVANTYGIPSPLLNDLEHATLANVREFQTALWEHTLVPDLKLRAGEIREQLLPMFARRPGPPATPGHAEFDLTSVAALQESQSEAWGRERQAIEVGALTVNEWRKTKGLPPVPWGDVWWAPVNKAPYDVVAAQATNNDTPELDPGTDDDQVELDAFAAEARELLDAFTNGTH